MKRTLPMSALISGLLAMPGMGLAPPTAGEAQQRAPIVRTFPAEMPAAVADEIRRLTQEENLDAFGMQELQRRIARDMQQRLAGFLKKPRQDV